MYLSCGGPTKWLASHWPKGNPKLGYHIRTWLNIIPWQSPCQKITNHCVTSHFTTSKKMCQTCWKPNPNYQKNMDLGFSPPENHPFRRKWNSSVEISEVLQGDRGLIHRNVAPVVHGGATAQPAAALIQRCETFFIGNHNLSKENHNLL